MNTTAQNSPKHWDSASTNALVSAAGQEQGRRASAFTLIELLVVIVRSYSFIS